MAVSEPGRLSDAYRAAAARRFAGDPGVSVNPHSSAVQVMPDGAFVEVAVWVPRVRLSEQAAPGEDLVESLHAVFTCHGIASRSDYPPELIGDLMRWAAWKCREAKRGEEQQVRAAVLRRCAEEIENGMRNRTVLPEELVAWYRAQADNMDPLKDNTR